MKKIIFSLSTCFLLSSAAFADDYTPLTLSGYNADVVLDEGETGGDALDNDGWFYFSQNRQANGGLPSSFISRGGVPYQLASFKDKNALHLRVKRKDEEKGTDFGERGTLEIPTPMQLQARQIWVLGVACNGDAGVEIIVDYTDGTSDAKTDKFKDWSQKSKDRTAFHGLSRVKGDGKIDGNYSFALFERVISTQPDKTVKSLSIQLTSGEFASILGVTALNGDAEVNRDKSLFLISNSHLDTQWNWTVKSTIDDYIPKTLTQNFERFEDPDNENFHFNFEGAIKYMWMKEYYPDKFEQLKKYVREGKWSPSGGALDANDVMVPSAESIIRNFLYGQKFYQKEFGVKGGTDIMLPDCFGFPYSLPTLGKHCGMTGFHSAKLGWGSAYDYSKLPPLAKWQGVDGSQIWAVLKPGAYDNYESYRKDMTCDEETFNEILVNREKYGLNTTFRYVGVRGDRGGGLDKETADWLSKSVDSEGPVTVNLTSPSEFFDYLDQQPDLSQVEVVDHELPMRTHGVGCYTSRTMLKYWNRKNELLADATEKGSVMADWLGGLDYQSQTITDAWKRIVWHQFHDDLTGTSVPQAYVYSCNDYVLSQLDLSKTLNNAVGAVAKNLDTKDIKGIPVVVYNPLSIERADVVEASIAVAGDYKNLKVTDKDGEEVPAQIIKIENGKISFIFVATVPSLGYTTYDVQFNNETPQTSSQLTATTMQMTNERYEIALNETGDVSSIKDKKLNKELLKAPIRLAMLFDESLTWPSWEIHGDQLERDPMEYVDEVVSTEVVENGPLRVSLKIVRKKNDSQFVQYIRLTSAGAVDRIDFVNEVNWQAKERLLKAVFPLTATNPNATYDLSIGVVQRGNSTRDMYEFSGHQWADLTDQSGAYGVSILNDCKYGWDKRDDNTLRLSLIHTPKVSNNYVYEAKQDIGLNKFTYSLYSHEQSWENGTQWAAAQLNQPLLAYQTTKHDGELGQSYGFVSLNTNEVAVKALKKAEDSDDMIIRLYELTGKSHQVEVEFPAEIVAAVEMNGVEEVMEGGAVSLDGKKLKFDIGKFQPKTFAVKLAPSALASVANEKPFSVKVDLDYNTDVMSSDENLSDGEFANTGCVYPAELIPDDLVADGISFQMGPREDGKLNAVVCKGQTITLPSGHAASKMYILAASSDNEGSEAVFKVDEVAATLKVEYAIGYVGVWSNEPYIKTSYKKENAALTATHRHNVSEGRNESYQYMYMFKYMIPVSANAKEITLPDDESLTVFAITLSDNKNDDTVPVSEVALLPAYTDTQDMYQGVEHSASILKPVVIKASGASNSEERPEFAADNDPYTKWCDTRDPYEWLEYDFKEPMKISEWYVMHAGIEDEGKITAEFRLQRYSNGGWLDVDEVVDNKDNITSRMLLRPIIASKVRLRVDKGEQGASVARIYEFAVFGEPAGDEVISQVISRTPSDGVGKQVASIHSASGFTNGGESPYYMLGGGIKYKWCNNKEDEPWAIIELSDIYTVDRFEIFDCKTRENDNNVAEYWIYASTQGTEDADFTEIVHRQDEGDISHKVIDLENAVDARYIKLKLKRPGNASRIYGFDIFGILKEKVDRGELVSVGKTILRYHDSVDKGKKEHPLHLLDGNVTNDDRKWCFYRGAESDPLKWVVVDLEGVYDINKLVIYDMHSNEEGSDKNIDGYQIYVSETAPTEEEMSHYKNVAGGENWQSLVDVKSGAIDENIKTHVLETPVRARYVKLEIDRERTAGTSRLFEFDVYGKITAVGVEKQSGDSFDFYPNPVGRDEELSIQVDGQGVVRIYSVNGTIALEKEIVGDSRIKMNTLSVGMYVLQVTIGDEVKQGKLFVK